MPFYGVDYQKDGRLFFLDIQNYTKLE